MKLISFVLLIGAIYLAWRFLSRSSLAVDTPAFAVRVGSVPYDVGTPVDQAIVSLAPASNAPGGKGCGCS